MRAADPVDFDHHWRDLPLRTRSVVLARDPGGALRQNGVQQSVARATGAAERPRAAQCQCRPHAGRSRTPARRRRRVVSIWGGPERMGALPLEEPVLMSRINPDFHANAFFQGWGTARPDPQYGSGLHARTRLDQPIGFGRHKDHGAVGDNRTCIRPPAHPAPEAGADHQPAARRPHRRERPPTPASSMASHAPRRRVRCCVTADPLGVRLDASPRRRASGAPAPRSPRPPGAPDARAPVSRPGGATARSWCRPPLAATLGVAVSTVRTHVLRLFDKTGTPPPGRPPRPRRLFLTAARLPGRVSASATPCPAAMTGGSTTRRWQATTTRSCRSTRMATGSAGRLRTRRDYFLVVAGATLDVPDFLLT